VAARPALAGKIRHHDHDRTDRTRLALPFFAVLRIAGNDAARFLQGQLMNDTRLLADGAHSSGPAPPRRAGSSHRCAAPDRRNYALLPLNWRPVAPCCVACAVARVDLQIATDLQVAWAGQNALWDEIVSFDSRPTGESLALRRAPARR
jgi:hypothetical protein